MNNRLYLGKGECYYIIGISDNGGIIGLQYKNILISLHPWKFKMGQNPIKISKV